MTTPNKTIKEIFTVTVGSQAHGLATPESDFDYRGVFIVPTKAILSLESTVKNTSWNEGLIDDTAWELGHFLKLATKCNPTILEVFLSPLRNVNQEMKEEAEALRALFPAVWNSKNVRDAFIGYGHNQRKKMLEGKDARPHKYAAAYLRTLWQAKELLETGTFTIRISDTEIGPYIKAVKEKDASVFDISMGAIINKCNELEAQVNAAYEKNPDKETDFDAVNNYLLSVREKHFNF